MRGPRGATNAVTALTDNPLCRKIAAMTTYRGINVRRNMPLGERLAFRSLRAENGCLLWTGSLSNGYGSMRWDGRPQLTHRLAWINASGPIPEGLYVCHKCDVPACIEPSHLFLGTHQDNINDMVAKGRRTSLRGECHGKSKLTTSAILSIRADARFLRVIAADYGVSQSLIHAIRKGKVWRHLLP